VLICQFSPGAGRKREEERKPYYSKWRWSEGKQGGAYRKGADTLNTDNHSNTLVGVSFIHFFIIHSFKKY
jgi:hypothetical protein